MNKIRLLFNVGICFSFLGLQAAIATTENAPVYDIQTSKSDSPGRSIREAFGAILQKFGADNGELGSPSLYDTSKVTSPLGNGSVSISASFYDQKYPSGYTPPAQHLGIDLPAPEGTSVLSPVKGRVLINRTNLKDPFEKYLVIKDESTGYEHVLGHIDSGLREGQDIAMGVAIGQIVKAGTGAHVHWGINSNSVKQATKDGWGWGRSPVSSTKQEAENKGWLDPAVFLDIAMQSSSGSSNSTTTVSHPKQQAKPLLYAYESNRFHLPIGSEPLEKSKCDRSLVKKIVSAKIKDMRTWQCLGYVNHKETAIVLLENTEKPSRAWGNPTWLFKVIAVGNQVMDLGQIGATNGLVPIIFDNTTIEILGISLSGWSGNVNEPPYSRNRLEIGSDGYRLAMITAGPEIGAGSSSKQVAPSDISKLSESPAVSARVDQGNRNVSDEFYINQIEAITKYSKWRTATFTFSEVSFSDGKIYVLYSELPTTFARQHDERMRDMEKGKNYWDNFLGATQNNPFGNKWTLACVFPLSQAEQLSKVPKGKTKDIQLKLLSAKDKNLVFDCKM